jgi:hypothetical protein
MDLLCVPRTGRRDVDDAFVAGKRVPPCIAAKVRIVSAVPSTVDVSSPGRRWHVFFNGRPF